MEGLYTGPPFRTRTRKHPDEHPSDNLARNQGDVTLLITGQKPALMVESEFNASDMILRVNESVHRMVYHTRNKAINDVASWIETDPAIRCDSTRRSATARPTMSNTN